MQVMTQTKPLHPDSGLPVPDQDALQQSENLVSRIKETMVEQGGAIGFDQYMALALYEQAWAITVPVVVNLVQTAILLPHRKYHRCSLNVSHGSANRS